MSISPELFKQIMSQRASTVNVVTTCVENKAHGMTATAFCSLSLDPLLVLVCIAKKQVSHQLLLESNVFVVNTLNAQQTGLAERFAGMLDCGPDRFAGVHYDTAITGSPILPNAVAWVDCRLWDTYDGGDHSIFVGEVVAGAAPNNNQPLLYYKRQWASLATSPILEPIT